MVDYVKILVLNPNIEKLLSSKKLNFKSKISHSTGEISRKYIAKYHFCKITVYETGTVLFSGSIHKLWNSINDRYSGSKYPIIGYNANNFKIDEIILSIEHLEKLLHSKAEHLKIQNIEFGLNLGLNYDPSLFIKGLLYHKGKMFEYKYENNFAQVEHQQYNLKIYNKSKQYNLKNRIIRIEVKIKKSTLLRHLNINTIQDLKIMNTSKIPEFLSKHIDEVVYYDYTINKKKLNKKERTNLNSFSNPRYWIVDLKANHRDRQKKKLNYIIEKHSSNIRYDLKNNILRMCNY